MRPLERHRTLLSLVDQRGDLTLDEACREMQVSPATIRRDFALLAEQGRVRKVWGGIRRLEAESGDTPGGDMLPSQLRETLQAPQKQRIAAAAARLLADDDILLIDGGTTTLQLAPHVADRPLRILTNSILIAHRIDALRRRPHGAEVFLTGGLLYPGSGLLVGPEAADHLSQHHAQWAILSTGGLDSKGGTNTNQLVVESERAMIRAAQKVMVLADSTKWTRQDMVRNFDWSEIAALVTDAPPPHPLPDSVQVIVAGRE